MYHSASAQWENPHQWAPAALTHHPSAAAMPEVPEERGVDASTGQNWLLNGICKAYMIALVAGKINIFFTMTIIEEVTVQGGARCHWLNSLPSLHSHLKVLGSGC